MSYGAAYWKLTSYRADRRQHHHRCQCCNRIIETGEHVYMARIVGRKTHALHVDCAGKEAINGFTHLQLLEAHGYEYLAAIGSTMAKRWLDAAAITKAGPIMFGASGPAFGGDPSETEMPK